MGHQVIELEVRLQEIDPPIWRTIEVPGTSSLEQVHFAIQVAMGWTNSHLHQFKIGDKYFGMADVDDGGDVEVADEREYRLGDLVHSGASFIYEYDFGDGWEHDVSVKRISTASRPTYTRCLAGARACPPEDCGGPGGYESLLEALADPDHEHHVSMVTWSNNFKPEHFVVPKGGLDLRGEMKRLEALANGEDEVDLDNGPLADLPTPLVEAVLALPPMARASLGALIAGSLADEVEHARATLEKLATAVRSNTPTRQGRRGRGARH